MPTENVNTVEKPLTIEEAVQRRQERRAQAQASGQPSGDAINKAAPKTDGVVEGAEVQTDPTKVTEPTGEANTGEDTEVQDGEGAEENQEDVYLVPIKNEKGEDVELEVPVSELIKGYMRHSDYTRKRTVEKQEHQSELGKLSAKAQELDSVLQDARAQALGELQKYQSIDWKTLQQNDPNEYNRLRLEYVEVQNQVAFRQNQLQSLRQYQNEKLALERDAYIKSQVEILREAIPEWESVKTELMSYLNDQGIKDFSPFASSAMGILAYKAKQFDDLQAKKSTVIQKKIDRVQPKSMGTGTSTPASEVNNEQLAALEAKARTSGKAEDVLALRRARAQLRK